MSSKKVLLTFDVEEFDIPEEFGHKVEFSKQIEVCAEGLEKLTVLLDKYSIKCTFFTTAKYAEEKPDLIKALSLKHEIASHGFYHSSFEVNDLKKSKDVIETIINKPVYGFRMARLAPVDDAEVAKAGYTYNSSMNPTYIPGRYNNLKKPRTIFYIDSVAQIPTSVTPTLRIPLFWLGFKNYPLWFFKRMMMRTLNHDKVLSLYFHPWEFTDIKNYKLPTYISKRSGDEMLQRLEQVIVLLKSKAEFVSMTDYLTDLKKTVQ